MNNDYGDGNMSSKLMDMAVKCNEHKYYIRKSYLEDGLRQIIQQGNIRYAENLYLNFKLLECLLHEQYHVFTNYSLKRGLIYQEQLEHIIWQNCNRLNDRFLDAASFYDSYPIYKTVPDEYYAFKYSKEKIMKWFTILNKMYDCDMNYLPYIKDENQTLNYYKQYCSNVDCLSIEELYKLRLEEYIQCFSSLKNISIEEIKKSLQLCPSVFHKI